VYFLLFSVYGNYLCYRARKIETVYAEGKYLGFALFNNLQITMCGLLLAAFVNDSPNPNPNLKPNLNTNP
jgi:hypothetical protein